MTSPNPQEGGKHTLGPWFVAEDDSNGQAVVRNADIEVPSGTRMTQAPATPELVARLRSYYPPICQEAADALEAQQARIAELEEALSPFSKAFRTLSSRWEDADTVWQTALSRPISVGQLRAADQALSSSQGRHEGGEG